MYITLITITINVIEQVLLFAKYIRTFFLFSFLIILVVKPLVIDNSNYKKPPNLTHIDTIKFYERNCNFKRYLTKIYIKEEKVRNNILSKKKKNGDEAAILPFISTTQQFYSFFQYRVNKRDKKFRVHRLKFS